MQRCWKWLPWWVPLMLYGGQTVHAQDAVFFPGAEMGIGIRSDAKVVVSASLVAAEFYSVAQVRFGLEAAMDTSPAYAVGLGFKIKEVVEALGGKWMLDKNLALSLNPSLDPFNVPKDKTVWDTFKVSITGSIIKF